MTLLRGILVNWLKTHTYLFSYGALFSELSGGVCIEHGMYLWNIKMSTGCRWPIKRNSKIIKWVVKSRQYNMRWKAK